MIGNDDQDYDPNWGPEDEYGDSNDDLVDDEEDVPDENRDVIGEDAEGDPIYEDEFDWDPDDYWRAQNQQIISELKRTGKARLAMSFGLPPDVSSEMPGPRVGDQLEVTKCDEGRFWKVSPPNSPWHALVVRVLHKEFEPLDLSTYTANSVVLDFLSRTNVPFRLSIAAIESGHYAAVDVTLYSNALIQIAGERELPATTNKTTAHSKGQLPDATKSNRTCPRCSCSDFYGDGSCRSCGRKPDLFDAAASVARDSWNGVKAKLKEWSEESPNADKSAERKSTPRPMNFSNQTDFFHHIDDPHEKAHEREPKAAEFSRQPLGETYAHCDEIPDKNLIAGTQFSVSLGVRPAGAMGIANAIAANAGFMALKIDAETIRFSNGYWCNVNPMLTFRSSPRGTDVFLTYSGDLSKLDNALSGRMVADLKLLIENILKSSNEFNVQITCPAKWRLESNFANNKLMQSSVASKQESTELNELRNGWGNSEKRELADPRQNDLRSTQEDDAFLGGCLGFVGLFALLYWPLFAFAFLRSVSNHSHKTANIWLFTALLDAGVSCCLVSALAMRGTGRGTQSDNGWKIAFLTGLMIILSALIYLFYSESRWGSEAFPIAVLP